LAATPDGSDILPMCWLCWASAGDDMLRASAPLESTAAQPAAPWLFLTRTGNSGIDGLQSGFAWSPGHPVSFAFPDSASDYEAFYGDGETARSFSQIGPAMRDAIRRILLGEAAGVTGGPGTAGPSITGFTNLAMVESAVDGAADIRIAKSSAPSTAWAYYPNGREGGDVWFGTRYAFDTPRLGTYQFATAMHEIGHALGLKHAHESWNGFAAMPLELDCLEFTVMSYRSKPGASTGTGYTNGTFDYPQGYMMLDIAALQTLYGADYTYRAGNTRYSWDPLSGETLVDGIGQGKPGDGAAGANKVFLTIWDGGGTDWFDLSNYAGGVAVDLAPGGWSVLSTAQLAVLDARDGTTARGNVFNGLLANGNTASLIENATGGAGTDTLAGNAGANRLDGGAGNDRLEGREGADLLIGGPGADTMIGGTGADSYVVDDPGDLVIETGSELDTITVEMAAACILPFGVEILRLGAAGRIGVGNSAANLLFGSANADRLDGGGGADMLEGGRGNDTLMGGTGADRFVLRCGDGFDHIEDFEPGSDRLVLTGFGLDADAVLACAQAVAGGVTIDLGGGDGVLLAGPSVARLSATDFIL
jgi:serralysin